MPEALLAGAQVAVMDETLPDEPEDTAAEGETDGALAAGASATSDGASATSAGASATSAGASATSAGASATSDGAPEPADAAPEGGDAERDPEELAHELFALLFASPDPLGTSRLAELAGLANKRRVGEALELLRERLLVQGLPLELRSVAGGWRLFTRPEMGELVGKLAERRPERISPAALETLAIVAYRQPVTKAEIEAIRGVGSGPVLRSLVDRRLVRVSGRAEQPGAPLLYGTTREFLETFGLDSVDDLPRDGELARD